MDITFKTKKMVENGLVLDDRGGWIPLIDKLRMERFFIDHLTTGEVLRNKRWVTIDEAKTIDASVKSQPVTETVLPEVVATGQPTQAARVQTPEVNAPPQVAKGTSLKKNDDEFSFNDFLNESDPVVEPEMEETNQSEITREHCSIMIKEGEQTEMAQVAVEDVPKIEGAAGGVQEEVLDAPDAAAEKVQVEKAPSVESFFVDHSEHETVILSTGKLEDLEKVDDSLIAVTMARATRRIPVVKYNENIEEIIESIEEFDEWEKDARKRQALFFAIASGVAAIIGSSAILLFFI